MSRVFALVVLQAIVALASPVTEWPELVNRQGAQSCRNQSCAVALVAGSTGATSYNLPYYPSGDTQGGDCCIIRYFPAAKSRVYAARPGLQSYCAANGGDAPADANPPGISDISSRSLEERNAEAELKAAAEAKVALTARDSAVSVPCKPNILVFAKGTFEPGDVGISIGNTLQQNLAGATGRWQVVGVNYDNGLDGDYCLGLPGGVAARTVINSVISTCPGSQLVVGGYSQGAMVARNAIARLPAAQVSAVSMVLNFGDPFCGAPIGQYSGAINVFCNQGDGVCDGQLNIGIAHLSYAAATSAGIALLQGIQK